MSRKRIGGGAVALVGILALTACTPTIEPAASAEAPEAVPARVIAVVDGDTIDVEIAAGEEYRVRVIGVDTPEIARDGSASECYAIEAREFVDELLYGKTVDLVTDPTQADVDAYGRLLRHVVVDARSVSELTIEAGYGLEYTLDKPYTNQAANREAQRTASDAGAGLWSNC